MATTQRRRVRWLVLGLVAVGGALGAASREGLSLAIPDVDDIPIVIPIVNVIGALMLGLLYEALTRTSIGDEFRTRAKLLIGTGFCGGFTTYSSLATDTAVLNSDGRSGPAFIYAMSTLVVGGLATWAGIVVGSWVASRPTRRGPA
jgi:CrcB protein